MINYTWHQATILDLDAIVEMAQKHFQQEIDTIYTPDPRAYARNVTYAIVNQHYSPNAELLAVAKDAEGQLLAYTWAKARDYAAWSDDEMIVIRMAHVDLQLSSRQRLRLIQDMLQMWENFARFANVKIICSTTMRDDQGAFLKLHAKNGYTVRGSYAYKKLNPTQATPAN
jgi:hypothetical protein